LGSNQLRELAGEVYSTIAIHYLKNRTVSSTRIESKEKVWQPKVTEIAPYFIADENL
jgi:hypothetical protein